MVWHFLETTARQQGAAALPSGVARNAGRGALGPPVHRRRRCRQGSRVLDLGCGKGTLLKMLVDAQEGARHRHRDRRGARSTTRSAKGLTVYHGDFDEGLSYYPDNSFDYVILSQTLQEARETVAVLQEALRVGQLRGGQLPQLRALEGAAAAAVHRAGAGDRLAALPVVRHAEHPLADHQGLPGVRARAGHPHRAAASTWGASGRVRFWPNLRAAYGVFVLEKCRRAGRGVPAVERPATSRRPAAAVE